MPNKPHRVILDTNLWISFLITKDYTKLDFILFSKKATLLFSEELMDEFLEVIKRPRLKKYFDNADVQKLISIINEYAELISVKNKVNICRDEKDNFLLSLAIEGQANFLITGDKDLLIIRKVETTKIISISDYINI